MCLWLLTACFGLLPVNQSPATIVVQVQSSAPASILAPTTTTTTTTTTARPQFNMTIPGSMSTPPAGSQPPGMFTGSSSAPPTGFQPPGMFAGSSSAPYVSPPASSIGSVLLPVLLCTDPDIVCIINPDDSNNTGPQIDPRLGTTPATSAAYQGPPIVGYSASVPTYDSAVRFPRERRSVSSVTVRDYLMNIDAKKNSSDHRIRKRQSCSCVPAGTCPTSNSGAGMIDLRIVTPGGGGGGQCPAGQVYCCSGSTTPLNTIACGTLQNTPAVNVPPYVGQASYAEYPWQAMLLTKQNDYIAGGVLVDQLNVLTVIHRMSPYIVQGTAPNVKVRLGEWDAAGTYEPVPYQEYNVLKVFQHPSYNPSTLQYDLMVVRLASPVPFTPQAGAAPTINRACLPPAGMAYTGQRCWVSGWGKNMFGVQGQFQQILKEVDVPIVPPAACQTQLQTARLGTSYILDTTSFICAGGEANKDSCTGDGGSGLVCQVNGQFVLVGLVSWGLGCAMNNVPAVYMNIPALLPWIQQQLATS